MYKRQEALYSLNHSQHLSAESTSQIKSNAYSFGCTFAEVEVDIPMCQVKLLDIVNVHDAGTIINPALAEAQVHGGMSMGIGFGLSEKLMYDEKTGRAWVSHLKFGAGVIRRIETLASDHKLVVEFSGYGEKTLLAKFAKLTKL